jgi:hypothetical protein
VYNNHYGGYGYGNTNSNVRLIKSNDESNLTIDEVKEIKILQKYYESLYIRR